MYNTNLLLNDSLFPSLLTRNTWHRSTNNLRVDIAEDEKSYIVSADVPGFDKKNLAVSFEDHVLTLSGKVSSGTDEKANDENQNRQLYSERYQSEFSRSFRFSKDVDAKKIKAKVTNGVLTVVLGKLDQEVIKKSNITIE